ncbi:MAG: peptidase domain-containing ABC transporter, partial [Phycisphaerae bacterium]
IVILLFSLIVGVLTLATPVAVQVLVNFVGFGGLLQPVLILGILLLSILTFAGAVRLLKAVVVEIMQRRVFVRVVGDLAYRLPRVRIDAYDRQHGPELVNRFFDVTTVQKVAATLLLDGIGVLLQAVIGLLVLAFYHPMLLWFDLVLMGLIAFIIFGLGRGAVKTAIYESKTKYAVAASLEEIARNPLSFKLSGGADFAMARANELARAYIHARKSHYAVVFRQVFGTVALQALASTALLTLGGWLVLEGQLTLGQLVAAELIVTIVLASITKMGKQLESIYDLLAAVDKLGQLMDLPVEISEGSAGVGSEGPARVAAIQLGYGYRDDRPVFTGLNFVVEPGQHVLIVGGHAAGKSTLVDVLSGLRRPTAGRIELDGFDYREFTNQALQQQVAAVKGLEIIEGDILENITLRRSEITYEAAREALQVVGLFDDVMELPEQMRTKLNSLGSPLSYAQAHQLMLARAIVAAPRVLILDNVLSEIPPEALLRLRQNANKQWNFTVIATAQREEADDYWDRVVHLKRAPRTPLSRAGAPAGAAVEQ